MCFVSCRMAPETPDDARNRAGDHGARPPSDSLGSPGAWGAAVAEMARSTAFSLCDNFFIFGARIWRSGRRADPLVGARTLVAGPPRFEDCEMELVACGD